MSGLLARLPALRRLELANVARLEDTARLGERHSSLSSLTLAWCTVGDWEPLVSLGGLRELALLGNNDLPDVEILKEMRSLKKVRVEGLSHHLGPEAQNFVAKLEGSGVRPRAGTAAAARSDAPAWPRRDRRRRRSGRPRRA
ncbi:hypothetical protein AB0J83_37285 [Actinoplanes sp. NPDC049596]|uniref:hypothetical protein n=1 Tax=unclassified Actinoplanes TaxID=2626549 RepID=UPI00341F66DC